MGNTITLGEHAKESVKNGKETGESTRNFGVNYDGYLEFALNLRRSALRPQNAQFTRVSAEIHQEVGKISPRISKLVENFSSFLCCLHGNSEEFPGNHRCEIIRGSLTPFRLIHHIQAWAVH